MKTKMVVTNLRIPEIDWLQIKTMAAELGMSANEYVNFLIKDNTLKQELAEKQTSWQDLPIWQLDKIAVRNKAGKKGKDLSDEDKVIYG